jgi:hypothetical protein
MKITSEASCKKALAKLDEMIAAGFKGDAKKERAFEKLARRIEAYQKSAGYFDFDDIEPKSVAVKAINLSRLQKRRKSFTKPREKSDKI